MNKEQVLERMEPILNTQVREIDHSPRTRITVTPDMITFRPGSGQRTLEMTKAGVQSVANFVGLPWNVAAKLQPATFGDVTTELLGSKRQYSLVVKDQRVNAVVKRGHFHTVNPERALRAIESAIPGIDFHRVLILDNLVANIEVIGEKREPVSRGDLIQAGANITFSPMGTVDPAVQAYVLRLTCTNGATDNAILREFHWGAGGDGDDIWQWFRRSTHDAYNALDRIVRRYRELMNENIAANERAAMLEAMLKQARISGEQAIAIRALAIENPPQNSYDMMNLLTFATSHLLERPQQVMRVRQAITQFTGEDSHARVCPVCHARRN